MNWKLLALILTLGLAGCDAGDSGEAEQTTSDSEADGVVEAVEAWVAPPYVMDANIPDHIRAAVEHSARPEADKIRDGSRRPGDVLTFAGLEPGMTVLDLVSASGFYAELLTRAVGPDGQVLAHNPPGVLGYYAEGLAARYDGDRLPGVEAYAVEMNQIDLAENSLDLAIMALNYHDIYYTPAADSKFIWPPIDTPTFLANVLRALKPGAGLLIIDHEAGEGAVDDAPQVLHRITSAQVISELEAAGFTLARSSDVLKNPEDDHSLEVFDPSIRGRTDRFVFLFTKAD